MKGLAMLRLNAVGWIEKDAPRCGPLDALVQPLAVAPCTSDVHTVWEGALGDRRDLILGHEAVGEVVEVGSLVRDFKPGDRVMVPMPNYDPLFDMVTRGGRKLVETPLVWKDGRYTFDFADMEAKAASGVKVLVLSSPHNPTGRVWTRQELEGVAAALRERLAS